MPEAEPVKTKKKQGSDKHSTPTSVTSETVHASVGVDAVLDPMGQKMGSDFGEAAFQRQERFAELVAYHREELLPQPLLACFHLLAPGDVQ